MMKHAPQTQLFRLGETQNKKENSALGAYLTAATASIALIGIYLAAILHGWRRGLGFSSALAILHAALFGILRSEQNALLLGSLLLFVALAGLMLGTRRIDWYRFGMNAEAVAAESMVICAWPASSCSEICYRSSWRKSVQISLAI